MKKYEVAKEYIIITLATLITASALFFFLIPSHLSVGSITGLAVVLSNFVPLPISLITMMMNVVLLAFGLIFIGREFGAKTIYTSLLTPVFLAVFEYLRVKSSCNFLKV